MVTLKDIATKCSLSVATVSKALNNMPDISPATVQRVQEAAQAMGYLPNAAARSMKTGRSMTIGMVVFLGAESFWTHHYSALIADSIHRVMEDSGYDLTPVSIKGAGTMGGYLNYCRYRNYDGLIVMSGGDLETSVTDLADSDFPLIAIDCQLEGRASVSSDNIDGVRTLVRHAYSRGHRRIAFVHGNDSSVTRDRVSGFRAACQELNLSIPEAYIREGPYLSREDSARATEALLALSEPPTCILYPDDQACLGGIRALKARGLSIPRDISIIGYDDAPCAEVLQPRLTTYRQNCAVIGASAARMLLEAIADPASFVPRHVIIPGKLIPGESVLDLNQP